MSDPKGSGGFVYVEISQDKYTELLTIAQEMADELQKVHLEICRDNGFEEYTDHTVAKFNAFKERK